MHKHVYILYTSLTFVVDNVVLCLESMNLLSFAASVEEQWERDTVAMMEHRTNQYRSPLNPRVWTLENSKLNVRKRVK